MKNARRMLEIPMPAAMPCKIPWIAVENIGKHKIKYACIVDAVESLRIRSNGVPHRYHEDDIDANGISSLSHYNLAHKFIPMPEALKIPDAKAAVDKKWETLETIPAWQLAKVRNNKEVIEEGRKKGRKVHFASLMDLCNLKNSELDPQYQKYKSRVVLRGDIVEDDSGSYAKDHQLHRWQPQTSWTSLQDYQDAQDKAAGAVSVHSQVKMEDAHKLLKIPKSECPDIWFRLPRHKWPKSWSGMEDPVVPLERNLYGHLLAGLVWEWQFDKALYKHGCEKVPDWECLFVNREKGLFLSVYTDEIELAGKKQNIYPML